MESNNPAGQDPPRTLTMYTPRDEQERDLCEVDVDIIMGGFPAIGIDVTLEDHVCHCCYAQYGQGDQAEWPVKTPCNHIFGYCCLKEWLPKNSCPVCRRKLFDGPADQEQLAWHRAQHYNNAMRASEMPPVMNLPTPTTPTSDTTAGAIEPSESPVQPSVDEFSAALAADHSGLLREAPGPPAQALGNAARGEGYTSENGQHWSVEDVQRHQQERASTTAAQRSERFERYLAEHERLTWDARSERMSTANPNLPAPVAGPAGPGRTDSPNVLPLSSSEYIARLRQNQRNTTEAHVRETNSNTDFGLPTSGNHNIQQDNPTGTTLTRPGYDVGVSQPMSDIRARAIADVEIHGSPHPEAQNWLAPMSPGNSPTAIQEHLAMFDFHDSPHHMGAAGGVHSALSRAEDRIFLLGEIRRIVDRHEWRLYQLLRESGAPLPDQRDFGPRIDDTLDWRQDRALFQEIRTRGGFEYPGMRDYYGFGNGQVTWYQQLRDSGLCWHLDGTWRFCDGTVVWSARGNGTRRGNHAIERNAFLSSNDELDEVDFNVTASRVGTWVRG